MQSCARKVTMAVTAASLAHEGKDDAASAVRETSWRCCVSFGPLFQTMTTIAERTLGI